MTSSQKFTDIQEMFRCALENIPGGRVVDIATGRGGFIQTLDENLASYRQIVGVDLGAEFLSTAREQYDDERVTFAQMDAARLGFAAASLDTVVISAGLHHLPDIQAVLAAMRRVLRSGGHFVLAEMHCDGESQAQNNMIALHHWVADLDTVLGSEHNHTLSRQAILDVVAGLELEEAACYDFVDQAAPMDMETIEQIETVIETRLKRLEGKPAYSTLATRAVALQECIHARGVQREPVLVWVGRG